MSDMPPPPPDDSGWSSQPPQPPPQPPPAPGGQAYLNPQAMTGWANLGVGGTVELASPGARLGARIIDIVIMVVVSLILFFVLRAQTFGLSGDSTDEEAAAFVGGFFVTLLVFAAVGVLYEVIMIALKGQTLGKMATSIKVVRADNGQLPGWGKAIGRWIIPTVLGVIPFVGWLLSLLVYISLLWDRARQGWHDKAAGTLVIKV